MHKFQFYSSRSFFEIWLPQLLRTNQVTQNPHLNIVSCPFFGSYAIHAIILYKPPATAINIQLNPKAHISSLQVLSKTE